jgi:hypothetical protein
MTDPIRAALERLLAVVKPKYTDPDEIVEVVRAIAAARAALAEPAPPAEGEVAELCATAYQFVGAANGPVELLDNLSAAANGEPLPHGPGAGVPWTPDVAQPVAVSERLPGPEDCDAEERCWIYMPDIGTAPSWRLVDPREIGPYHSHWLPAHALPTPGDNQQ